MDFACTTVIAHDGNSYPASGCRIHQIETGNWASDFFFELQVILPNGNVIVFERSDVRCSSHGFPPNKFLEERDMITKAIINGDRILDLREASVSNATNN